MSHTSAPELLSLHGVRVLGGPTVGAVAARFGLDPVEVREHVLDAQASGWVTRHDYYGETWTVTELGRDVNERMLAEELESTGLVELVQECHRRFLRLNPRHGQACTNWQLRPTSWDPLAVNDHSDPEWDDVVLEELGSIDRRFAEIANEVAARLTRFTGYSEGHSSALARARDGAHGWIDAPDRASCQLIWIQFHEDLLATLGIPRGSDG